MLEHHTPLILVNADQRELDGYLWHAAIDTYLLSLKHVSRVMPLIVPAFGNGWSDDDLLALLARADGLLTTGSRSNVHPSQYGATPTQAHEPYDRPRDETTLRLMRLALDQAMPLLAICRGHQELNVAFGGTLATEIQEQEDRMDHRGGPSDMSKDERFRLNHPVTLTEDGMLYSLLGQHTVLVNSVHRQAIDTLGDGLRVEARADDGTIEAISVADAKAFALGLQWHPEHWVAQSETADPPSTMIFKAFGDAARAYQDRQN